MLIIGNTIGEVETPLLSDGSDMYPLFLDTSGRVIALVGWDGSQYVPLKTNATGQLEVEVKGAA